MTRSLQSRLTAPRRPSPPSSSRPTPCHAKNASSLTTIVSRNALYFSASVCLSAYLFLPLARLSRARAFLPSLRYLLEDQSSSRRFRACSLTHLARRGAGKGVLRRSNTRKRCRITLQYRHSKADQYSLTVHHAAAIITRCCARYQCESMKGGSYLRAEGRDAVQHLIQQHTCFTLPR